MVKSQETTATKSPAKREILGGCHCHAVRFKATVAADAVILRCNCSICSMTGFDHLIVRHQDFNLHSGQAALKEYTFNTHTARHLFCSVCGIKSFYQPRSHPDCWSINSHCIDHFDASKWRFDDFDGQNWQSAHVNIQENSKDDYHG